MEEEITPKIRLQVLFQTGVTSPVTLSNTLGMPLRIAERYVSKLRKGKVLIESFTVKEPVNSQQM